MGWLDSDTEQEDASISLYQDIIENLEDLNENNAPLIKNFIEETIKEQNEKSTFIPETTRIQSKLSFNRQQKVLTYAIKQLEEQNKVTSLDEYRRKTTVKRVHAAAAGVTGEELFDDLLEEEIEFYEDEVPNGTDFCVLVNGDSMEPAIREGTYAFFKEVHEINDGGIALVTLDGAGFIKRVDKYYDHIELISINPKYDSITVSSYNQFKVIGKLVM
ncbi:S24 family peptidase [Mammaliicoccus sciuri]|nr:S24 family peptidase [Mammaliicoccus sciuri]WQK64771.1 S24 family peptidase [Mammaliicoccus sciuri]